MSTAKLLSIIALLGTLIGCSKPDNAFRDRFRWMAGHWEGKHENSRLIESWKWNKHRYEGVAYSITDGDTTVKERIYLEEFAGIPSYVIYVNSRGPYLFGLAGVKGESYTFSNDDHDFPSVIVYEHETDSLIHVSLMDADRTEATMVSYEMRRVTR